MLENVWFVAAIWMGLALLASLISIRIGVSVALVEILIGVIAGILVVLAVFFFDKIKLDDPVGATSVHLANGVFGTLCVGLFGDPTVCPAASVVKLGLLKGGGMAQLMPQMIGVVSVGAFVLVISTISWMVIKAAYGLRVTPAEEIEGLDVGEHGNVAYADFQAKTS